MTLTSDEIEIEKAKIDLELRRLAVEEKVQGRELTLKEKQHIERSISPALATVAGAIIALVSGWIGTNINSSSNETISETNAETALDIERAKVKGNLDLEISKQASVEKLATREFESTLVLKAIETEDRSEAIRNLRFFVDAGFIEDKTGKIANLTDEQLPSQVFSSSVSRPELADSYMLILISEREKDALARVAQSDAGHFGKYGYEELRNGILGIVDIILNRVAHKGYPDSIFAVVDQNNQFSSIKTVGTWEALPPAKEEISEIIHNYLIQRAEGAPSLTRSTNYLNPYLSTAESLADWGNFVVANAELVSGSNGQKDILYFGFPPRGTISRKYKIGYNGIVLNPKNMPMEEIVDYSQSIVEAARKELKHFGNGKYKESDEEQFARVGTYWSAIGRSYDGRSKLIDSDGKTYNPSWTAPFVGYVLSAGTGGALSSFENNSRYLQQFLPGFDNQIYTAEPADELAPQPGDLIIRGTGRASDFDFDEAVESIHVDGSFPAHTEIVVEVDRQRRLLKAVGGNVRNSVVEQSYALDGQGILLPRKLKDGTERPWISVMQLRR